MFSQDIRDRQARVQGGDRVLEDHLQVGAQAPPGAAVERRDVGAEHLDRTRLRRGEFQNLVQRGRFARSRFTDDAQRATLAQFEADTVDGPHLADLTAQQHTFRQGIGLDQIADRNTTGGVSVASAFSGSVRTP